MASARWCRAGFEAGDDHDDDVLESWRRAMGVRDVRLRVLAAMHGQIDYNYEREAHACAEAGGSWGQ
jgi:hypothetical protein